MLIASFRAGESHPMASVGFLASLDFFRHACSRVCSDALFSKGSRQHSMRGQLHFFTALSGLNDKAAFAAALAPLRRTDWVVYAKRTFAGPKRVLAYLARYTHRVAMTNNRLLEMNGNHVSFSCKDSGGTRKVMTLKAGEFIRRFLLHVLPDGFHRIRNYGLLANGHRAEKLAVCRRLLEVPSTTLDRSSDDDKDPDATDDARPPCPCCGGCMQMIESFRGSLAGPFRIRRPDTS
jgi:putative transposase